MSADTAIQIQGAITALERTIMALLRNQREGDLRSVVAAIEPYAQYNGESAHLAAASQTARRIISAVHQ